MNIPAEGDYVIWHSFRVDHGRYPIPLSLQLDGSPHTLMETYDLTNLEGVATRKEYVWSRYAFLGAQP